MRHLKPSIALLVTAICAASVANAADSQSRAIDVAHSHMTVYVFKQGLFSFAADNHEIDAPIVAGSVDGSTGSVQLSVDATKLKVLDPKMSAGKRDQVQSNMTGSNVLDVAKYPKIEFRSTKVAIDGQHWNVTGDLTLHGQTHPIVIDVVSADASHFTGSVMVRQSDFGITPIRILGGTVTVKNDVKVEFAITLAAK
jgi:polyisoprenoid-binding protein YceI